MAIIFAEPVDLGMIEVFSRGRMCFSRVRRRFDSGHGRVFVGGGGVVRHGLQLSPWKGENSSQDRWPVTLLDTETCLKSMKLDFEKKEVPCRV